MRLCQQSGRQGRMHAGRGEGVLPPLSRGSEGGLAARPVHQGRAVASAMHGGGGTAAPERNMWMRGVEPAV